MFWFSLVLLACSQATSSSRHSIPKTMRQQAMNNIFQLRRLKFLVPAASVVFGSSIGSTKADEQKGKFEYQPALQGLDYGKVIKAVSYHTKLCSLLPPIRPASSKCSLY